MELEQEDSHSIITSTENSPKWFRGKIIGQGSFGTVSIGINRTNGAVFAVKSVNTISCLPSQLKAIENEIRILRFLNSSSSSSSPFIIRYLTDDFTTTDSNYYNSRLSATTTATGDVYRNLHMEYIEGGTATDIRCIDVNNNNNNKEDLIRQYTWCLVNAMNYIHAKGIVHCDIKGSNLLLDSRNRFAKLADFGSAKMITAGSTQGKIVPRGSPLWMAPEVVRGESQGYESDVWSLGCTVIEMVTGKAVWEDQGLLKTLTRIGYDDEDGLPRLPEQLSTVARDFVEKCLRREPERRWSCDQLLKHPFLINCLDTSVYSPSSVLIDWGDEVEVSQTEDDYCSPGNGKVYSAEERIRELSRFGEEGDWESDGWTVVRDGGGGLEKGVSSEPWGRGVCDAGEEGVTNWERSIGVGLGMRDYYDEGRGPCGRYGMRCPDEEEKKRKLDSFLLVVVVNVVLLLLFSLMNSFYTNKLIIIVIRQPPTSLISFMDFVTP